MGSWKDMQARPSWRDSSGPRAERLSCLRGGRGPAGPQRQGRKDSVIRGLTTLLHGLARPAQQVVIEHGPE